MVQLCTLEVLGVSSHPDSAGAHVHGVLVSISSVFLTQSEGVAVNAHAAYRKRFTVPVTAAKLVHHPSPTIELTLAP